MLEKQIFTYWVASFLELHVHVCMTGPLEDNLYCVHIIKCGSMDRVQLGKWVGGMDRMLSLKNSSSPACSCAAGIVQVLSPVARLK